jgi:hypothetical protein
MNQTAHISLQSSNNVKEQTPKTQKQTVAQILSATAYIHTRMPQSLLSVITVFPIRQQRPRRNQPRLSAAGEGGSTHNNKCPQPLF